MKRFFWTPLVLFAVGLALPLWLFVPSGASTYVSSAVDRVEVAAAQCSSYIASGQLRSGQTLMVGAGRINAPPGGFRIPSGVRVVGAWPGRNRITGGTIVRPFSPNDDAFVLLPADDSDPAGNVRLENLIVKGPELPGEGRGFVVDVHGPGIPAHIELVRCMAWGVGSDGFYIRQRTGPSIDCVLIQEASACRNGRHGYYLERAAWARIQDSIANVNGGSGLFMELCDLSVVTDFFADGNAGGPQIVVANTMDLLLVRGASERFYGGVGLEVRGGRHVRVDGMSFLSGATQGQLLGTSIRGVQTEGLIVDRCFHRKVRTVSTGAHYTAAQSNTIW